jgi:hypothetical protein
LYITAHMVQIEYTLEYYASDYNDLNLRDDPPKTRMFRNTVFFPKPLKDNESFLWICDTRYMLLHSEHVDGQRYWVYNEITRGLQWDAVEPTSPDRLLIAREIPDTFNIYVNAITMATGLIKLKVTTPSGRKLLNVYVLENERVTVRKFMWHVRAFLNDENICSLNHTIVSYQCAEILPDEPNVRVHTCCKKRKLRR